ncbi:hypothetical protein UFOVP1623_3 [uncultured Caudovirales phage]|uniref:Phosphoadenosine phosphosulphate reductase n=1 Tax=uncultured Caudovirales phage TaxID=2100421 RepID=A0A6J5SZ96_9CAUD|nr:hypothetical protein UFOVP1376_6 [uncultured Caudovirales phage]CAB4220600.1 hypothetical protein UFOVP1623_3 [uncultured Caudovirales phage]
MLNIISLGAGVQSTTMALMAAHGEITPMPDAAIFADTQSEPRAVYEHLKWLMSPNVLPFSVHIVTKGNLGKVTLDVAEGRAKRCDSPPLWIQSQEVNSAAPISRACTGEYKIKPILKKVDELCGLKPYQRKPKQPIVNQWIGISTDEVVRAKKSDRPYIIHRWPLIELGMNRTRCISWLKANDYPVPTKSACTFCPYKQNDQWRQLRDRSPEEWAETVEFDRRLRAGGKNWPRTAGPVFLHRDLVPLGEAKLDGGMNDLWGDMPEECEGMCGV